MVENCASTEGARAIGPSEDRESEAFRGGGGVKMVSQYSYAGEAASNRRIFQWAGALGIVALIVLGTHSAIFALAALGIAAIQIVFGEEDFSWKLVFIIFSFANIFKLAPDTTSLFTYLILLFDLMLFIKYRTLPSLWIFFAIYTVAVPFIAIEFSCFHLLRWIKLLCSLLMMFYFFERDTKGNEDEFFLYFIVGVILASLTYYLDSGFFRVSRYTFDIGVYYVGMSEAEKDLVRFAGLYSDPNYYSVNVIISMCLTVILFHRDKIKLPVFALFMAVLFYFIKETLSKSSFLMSAVPLLMFLHSNRLKQRRTLQTASVVMFSVALIYLIVTGGGEIFSTVFGRLSAAKGDINALTTGRFDVWVYNIEYFMDHPWRFLFGKGINSPLINNKGHHNVYIEMIWHVGLVGFIMIFETIKQVLQTVPRRQERNPMNYSVLFCAAVMYFFLSVLFYFDPPYHLMIAFTVMNMDLGSSGQGTHSSTPG